MKPDVSKNVVSLEDVVGLAVFSLLIVVLCSGFYFGMRNSESGERAQVAVSELRLAGSFIRKYASQAIPLAISDNNAWQLWFEGKAQRLVFITAVPAHLGPGGTYEMTLKIIEQENAATLTLSRRLLHPDADPGKAGSDEQPRSLVENLESADFAYFGASGDHGEASWHASWAGKQRLPRLVRLRLVSRLVGAWPEIVIGLPSDDNRYQRAVVPGGPGWPIPAPESRL
jgi:general secretion pathway protein J